MTVGGCAEEEMPIALHAVWAIRVGQPEIPLIEMILGAVGPKSHPGLFSVPALGEIVSNFPAEATGCNECHHGSTLS